MVGFIIWLLGAIIMLYVMVKLYWNKVEEVDDQWVFTHYFWVIVVSSVFWYISLPIMGIWKLLDKTIGKYFNNKI